MVKIAFVGSLPLLFLFIKPTAVISFEAALEKREPVWSYSN